MLNKFVRKSITVRDKTQNIILIRTGKYKYMDHIKLSSYNSIFCVWGNFKMLRYLKSFTSDRTLVVPLVLLFVWVVVLKGPRVHVGRGG